jgi:hypothetical protein
MYVNVVDISLIRGNAPPPDLTPGVMANQYIWDDNDVFDFDFKMSFDRTNGVGDIFEI